LSDAVLKFEQVPVAGTNAAPVLLSFDVEATGAELRIVDRDGSVYRGPLPPEIRTELQRAGGAPNGAMAATVSPGWAAAPASAAPGGPAGSYTFRVIGTNRILNQRVEFTGSLFAATNRVQTWTQSVAGFSGAGTQSVGQFFRIEGTAVIGGRTRLRIEAAPLNR
jgi:hypothetical protein